MKDNNPIVNGAIKGVISQFVADIVISLYFNGLSIIISDINISESSAYIAAVATGITRGFCQKFLDSFALNVLATVVYTYTFNLFNALENNTQINFSTQEIVFDIGVSIILVYAFDPTAKESYQRFKLKKMGYPINTTIETQTSTFLFLLIITDTYIAFKNANRK